MKRSTGKVDRRTAADILDEMAATFRERNGRYKDNFKNVAPVMKALWPDGIPSDVAVLPHFHLVELIVVKLTRFANTGLQHKDSIHDAGVYSAIIEAILEENE